MSKGVSAPYEVVGIEAVAVEGVAVMEGGQGQDTSLAGQLRDLQASKEQDLLSEAEYAAARASVLARFRDGAPAAAPIPTPITPNPALNGQLNDTARNTSDTGRIRDLVSRGAQLESTNGAPWNHTPLHQACYHGRLVIVQTLLEVGAYEKCAQLASNPCGRGGQGLPIELARGGHHYSIVALLEAYKNGEVCKTGTSSPTTVTTATTATSPGPFAGHIPASDIAGLWCCMCWPFGFAIFVKQFVSDDELLHSGCLLAPIPIPFCGERRLRHKGTNGFYKSDEPGNVDLHSSKSCVCNGPSCSLKLC